MPAVQSDPIILPVNPVAGQRHQILQSIQRLSMMPNQHRNALALKGENRTVRMLLHLNRNTVQAHRRQNFQQVSLR